MKATKEDVLKLIRLQDHDKASDDLRGKIEKIPEDIEALKAEVSGEEQRLAAADQKSKDLLVRKKDKENEMAQKEGGIKKHQGELNAVKTNEAFKALLKEIDDAKAAVGELETGILELMEEIDAAAKEVKAAKADLDRANEENGKRVKVLEDEKVVLEAKLKEEDAKRAAMTEGLSAGVLEFYEKTRERRGGVAMAEIKGESCEVCHLKQPPHTLVDIKKAAEIVTCESCQRILYQTVSASAGPA